MKKLVLLFLFLSCSQNLILPPNEEAVTILKKSILKDTNLKLTEADSMALLFLKGKFYQNQDNLYLSCLQFQNLKKNYLFPLTDLIEIEILNSCHFSKNERSKKVHKLLSRIPDYLKNYFYKTEINKSILDEDWDNASSIMVELAKEERIKKLKEELALKAISFARKSQSEEKLRQAENYYLSLAPRFVKNPKKDQLYIIGRDFEKTRDFLKARKSYRKIIDNKQQNIELRIKSYYRYAMSFKLQRLKPEYAQQIGNLASWLRKLLEKHPKDEFLIDQYGKYQVIYARALWTVNKRSEAKKVIEQYLFSPYKNATNTTKAYWVMSAIELEEKNNLQSLNSIKAGLEQKGNDQTINQKLAWNYGWNLYLLEQYQAVIDHFETQLSIDGSFYLKPKYSFWLAKSYLKLNQSKIANKIFGDLAENYQFNYYGILSSFMIDKTILPVEVKTYESDLYLPKLSWLIALNLNGLAKEYLKSIQGNYTNLNQTLNLLPFYHKAQWYEGGIFKFFKIKTEQRKFALEKIPQAAFPIPYYNEVLSASERFKFPNELIYSISRQESAFNPTIRSWADAFGLMQLLPSEAKKLSKKLNLPYNDFTDLFDPSLNILLGTKFLSDLRKNSGGNFIDFVASYNAGKRPVSRWRKERNREDPVEFIEMIPYGETQKYVKLVLRNYITYQRLLGKSVNKAPWEL